MLTALMRRIAGSRTGISGQELLESVKAMTDDERREMAELLIPGALAYAGPKIPEGLTGLAVNQFLMKSLTSEQREKLVRDSLL
jgi:hypothetical protein